MRRLYSGSWESLLECPKITHPSWKGWRGQAMIECGQLPKSFLVRGMHRRGPNCELRHQNWHCHKKLLGCSSRQPIYCHLMHMTCIMLAAAPTEFHVEQGFRCACQGNAADVHFFNHNLLYCCICKWRNVVHLLQELIVFVSSLLGENLWLTYDGLFREERNW